MSFDFTLAKGIEAILLSSSPWKISEADCTSNWNRVDWKVLCGYYLLVTLQNLGIAKFIDMFDLSLVLKIYLPHIKLWKCPRFWKLDIYHNQRLDLLFGYNLRKFLSNYSF